MSRDAILKIFAAIGSAHAGESLTPEVLLHRLRADPDFARRFNGPPPPAVEFPDEETAALAVDFEQAGRRARKAGGA